MLVVKKNADDEVVQDADEFGEQQDSNLTRPVGLPFQSTDPAPSAGATTTYNPRRGS